MGALVLTGDTSGSVTVAVPTVAGTNTVTIPAVTGTAVVSGQNSAITSSTAQASTSGTSIDFTSIPSWVKRVTVMFNGVSTNGSSNVQVQIGSSSFTTSGYVGSTSTLVNAATIQVNSFTGGFGVGGGSAGDARSGHMIITNVSGNIWVASINGTTASGTVTNGGGVVTLSGVLDRVRITTVGGTDTFDAGSINILYE